MSELTREMILAMPAGREMDALVAERAMKIKVRFIPPFAGWTANTLDYCYDQSIPEIGIMKHGGPIPKFSTEIAAAWQVVEKLQAMGHWVVINTTCDIGLYDIEVRRNGRSSLAEVVIFEPAPLAICRAALLATLEGK